MADNIAILDKDGAVVNISSDDGAAYGQVQRFKIVDGLNNSFTETRTMTADAATTDAAFVVQDAKMRPLLGALTETAPGTDTASAGLNGRLQRVAQNLTSLYTFLTTGATPFRLRSGASNNATTVKASAGRLFSLSATNTNATERYLKLYNKASPPAPATDNALLVGVHLIPGSSSGTNIPLPIMGLAFSTGISYALVTGSSDTDNTSVAAGEQMVNGSYL